MYVIDDRMNLVQMVVHEGVYRTEFLIFTALLDCLTFGRVDKSKATICTEVRCTICTDVLYVQMYDMYSCTLCADVLYVQMYDM